MEGYVSEDEQVEALKKWWKENWKSLASGVVMGVSILFALWAWRDYTRNQAEGASTEYQLLINAVDKGNASAAVEHGERIIKQYGQTSYAVFAAFAMAKLEVDKNDNAAARKHLEWALQNADSENMQHIARLRLLRVMLDQNEAQAVLNLISSVPPGSFLAEYEEIKGDSYVQLKQLDKAKVAYQDALGASGKVNAEKHELLQMKLDDLGNNSHNAQGKAE